MMVQVKCYLCDNAILEIEEHLFSQCHVTFIMAAYQKQFQHAANIAWIFYARNMIYSTRIHNKSKEDDLEYNLPLNYLELMERKK
jgi:hypothetical protein